MTNTNFLDQFRDQVLMTLMTPDVIGCLHWNPIHRPMFTQTYTGLIHTSWTVRVYYITQSIAHTHVHWRHTHRRGVEEKQIVGIPSIHSACSALPALLASPLNKHQPPPLWCPLCSHTTMLFKIAYTYAMHPGYSVISTTQLCIFSPQAVSKTPTFIYYKAWQNTAI